MGYASYDAIHIKAAALSKIKIIVNIFKFTKRQFNFPDNLAIRGRFIDEVRNLPCEPHIKAKIMNEYEKFKNPRAIVVSKKKEWENGCAAPFRYELVR